jgi:hypothetical protein
MDEERVSKGFLLLALAFYSTYTLDIAVSFYGWDVGFIDLPQTVMLSHNRLLYVAIRILAFLVICNCLFLIARFINEHNGAHYGFAVSNSVLLYLSLFYLVIVLRNALMLLTMR